MSASALAAPELLIDSATGVAVTLPIAGPGARASAFLIDWHIRLVLAVAWYVTAALLYNRSFTVAAPLDPDATWFGAVVAPAVGIFLLYHAVLEIALRGRTPGKRMAGVRIVTAAGTEPGTGALVMRNVFRIIDSFPLVYGVGLFAVMLTRSHVRVGDLAAGTVLVYDPARRHSGKEGVPALQAADDYRRLAHRLARARAGSGGDDSEALEATYARAHLRLHRPAVNPLQATLHLFRDEIPEAIAQLRTHLIWVTFLFVLALLSGSWLVRTYPQLIGLFVSPALIATVERGELWTQGLLNIVPSSVLSIQILANNVSVSLFAFCAGFLFGLGTFYIVTLNGLMLGAVFAFTAMHGLDDELFAFIVAHGCVELSVMCLSGAAGAAVGEALVRPRGAERTKVFQEAARRGGKILFACVLLLIGAGFIEGYVSPDPQVPLEARVALGVGYWLFMVALLRGWLFGRPRAPRV